MCVREGKEFEELFPHLGRVCTSKSPFNRRRDGRRRFHFVSFATDGAGRNEEGKEGGAASQIQRRGNVPPQAFKSVHFQLKQDFYEACETEKKGEGTEDDIQTGQGSMSSVSINIVMALPRPRLIHLSGVRPT